MMNAANTNDHKENLDAEKIADNEEIEGEFGAIARPDSNMVKVTRLREPYSGQDLQKIVNKESSAESQQRSSSESKKSSAA